MHPDPHHPAPTAHAHNIHAPDPAEDERRDDLPGTGLAWGLVVCAAGLTAFGGGVWLFASLVTAWVMPL
jgi:ABC-type nickel/cobalt efflux system permease component RcnA